MNMRLKVLFMILLVTTALSGCSSGVYNIDWGVTDKVSFARICLARKAEVLGSAVSSPVFFDDKRIADLRIGQWFCTDILSGLHSLQMEYTTLAVNFLPKTTYHYFMENGLELGLRVRTVDADLFKKLTSADDFEDISLKTP